LGAGGIGRRFRGGERRRRHVVSKEGFAVNVFVWELKKMWRPNILLLIAVLSALAYRSFMWGEINRINYLNQHKLYNGGPYQDELMERYGHTLSTEEIEHVAQVFLPENYAKAYAQLDALIAAHPVFAEHGIYSYDDYLRMEAPEAATSGGGALAEMPDWYMEMERIIRQEETTDGTQSPAQTGWQGLQHLREIEYRYVKLGITDDYIAHDMRPVVKRQAARYKKLPEKTTLMGGLDERVSLYMMPLGIWAIVAVLMLTAPLPVTDRARRMHLLQYASVFGRKMCKIQLAAAAFSSFVLSLVLTGASVAVFATTGMLRHWHESLMAATDTGFFLYDITLGQYVLMLCAMIIAVSVGVTCLGFVLARFSSHVVNAVLKLVPLGVLLSVLTFFTLSYALNVNNFVFGFWRGALGMPEVMVCAFVCGAGLVTALAIAARERSVDVT
jgi:hypothetical protein